MTFPKSAATQWPLGAILKILVIRNEIQLDHSTASAHSAYAKRSLRKRKVLGI